MKIKKETKNSYSADLHYGDLFDDKYMVMRFSQNVDFMEDKIRRNKMTHILDVGGYTGDSYEYMKRRGLPIEKVEYTIVDYDDAALAIAKKRGCKVHKYDFNFENLEDIVKGKVFDIIICTEVLEHIIDPHKQLRAFRKLLHDNGLCIISLPNENTIFHRIYSITGMGIDQCAFELYKHFHFPTVKQARDLVSTYFKIEDHAYYINFGGRRTKFEGFSRIFTLIPDSIWYTLTNLMPGLLARGTIFKLKRGTNKKK